MDCIYSLHDCFTSTSNTLDKWLSFFFENGNIKMIIIFLAIWLLLWFYRRQDHGGREKGETRRSRSRSKDWSHDKARSRSSSPLPPKRFPYNFFNNMNFQVDNSLFLNTLTGFLFTNYGKISISHIIMWFYFKGVFGM